MLSFDGLLTQAACSELRPSDPRKAPAKTSGKIVEDPCVQVYEGAVDDEEEGEEEVHGEPMRASAPTA